MIRGIYFHNWDPSGKPDRSRTAEEFLARVGQEL
jgi:uncharacterized protein (DUF2267 family)